MGSVITGVHRLLTGLFTMLAISTGFAKLVAEARQLIMKIIQA
jgi:hypothetical protein